MGRRQENGVEKDRSATIQWQSRLGGPNGLLMLL